MEPRHLAGVATALLGAFNNGYVLCVIAGAILQLTAQFSLTASVSSLVVSVLMLGALLGSVVGWLVITAFVLISGVVSAFGVVGYAMNSEQIIESAFMGAPAKEADSFGFVSDMIGAKK